MYKVGFWSYYKEEVKVIRDRDPAIKKDIEAILYPSFGRYIIIEGLTNFMNGERFLRQEGFLREQPERQE